LKVASFFEDFGVFILAFQDRILSRVNLICLGLSAVQSDLCSYYAAKPDTAVHLLLQCSFAVGIWRNVWANLCWSLGLMQNSLIFRNGVRDGVQLFDLIKIRTWIWLRHSNHQTHCSFQIGVFTHMDAW
jgi:hypothetical protein